MSNKFLIPFFLVLLFSIVYNYIQIDHRMDLLKAQNSPYVMGISASIVGIIFCIVVFKLNSVNKLVNK